MSIDGSVDAVPSSRATTYDRYARLVQRTLGVPVALVSLVESTRQVFPGQVGLAHPYCDTRQTPLTHSFCQYVVHDRQPLVIEDARQDPRLRDNPAIEDLGVVAYAGFPLTDPQGRIVGSLCAIDTEPRAWTQEDLTTLEDLAAACSSTLADEALRSQLGGRADGDLGLGQRSRVLLALSESLADTYTLPDVGRSVAQVSVEQLGCLRAGLWLRQTDLPQELSEVPEDEAPRASVLAWMNTDDPADWQAAVRSSLVPLDERHPVGRAARLSVPEFFSSRDAQNAAYPHLAGPDQVGERRAFLPLISRGHLYGTLSLVWPEADHPSVAEQLTVTALASYTAQAVERAVLRQERAEAMLTLQRSMIPSLPDCDHVQLAARYSPASAQDQVGGDWYDALEVEPGALEIVIGDVVGHDISAAATMGQMRTMLRALTWAIDDGPAQQIARLDHTIADLRIDGMSTLVHGRLTVLDDGGHEFRWTNAGHPPPLLVEPDGTARWLDPPPANVLIGVFTEAERHEHVARLAPDSTVLLFTDGLVERRHELLEVGLERLRLAGEHHHALPVEAFLAAVLDELLGERLDDDVAVLAVRLTPP